MFQTRHAVLPQSSHDEFAREEFTGPGAWVSESLPEGQDPSQDAGRVRDDLALKLIGTPERVADKMQAAIEEIGGDDFFMHV